MLRKPQDRRRARAGRVIGAPGGKRRSAYEGCSQRLALGLASLAVPACAGAPAGGRDLPRVAEFVEHKPHRRWTYTWECPLDVARAKFEGCVAQDVLADAILLGAPVGTGGGNALLEIFIGAVEDLDQERRPWPDRVLTRMPATLRFVEALVVGVLRLEDALLDAHIAPSA